MFEVDEELISLINEYDTVKTVNGNTDGSYTQVPDKETGEDVTQSFFDEGNYEAVLNALEEYRTVIYE